ncbi:MAG: PA0069 family radical SAM protein [Cryomorphaceae bacterium]
MQGTLTEKVNGKPMHRVRDRSGTPQERPATRSRADSPTQSPKAAQDTHQQRSARSRKCLKRPTIKTHMMNRNTTKFQPGQGAQTNPHNRFHRQSYEVSDAFLDYLVAEGEEQKRKTKVIEIHPKTIVNAVKSPDVPMQWSLNPYQGCEHGCTYCYARNSHEYWGYSAGIDFERVLLVKRNAPALLEATLKQRSWKGDPVVLSGNTDCYQPIERQFGITRKLLEVFWKFKHPVGIITKNALVQRDIDLLGPMAEKNLAHVVLSITTLDDDLRRKMEPRTASVKKRLETVEALSAAGIPVTVMMAPIVPGLNAHEIFNLLKAVKKAGARDVSYTLVRLNGQVADIFSDWVRQTFPDRAERVLNQIRSVHGGSLQANAFGRRMRGSGKVALHIKDTFSLARQRVFGMPDKLQLNRELYQQYRVPQLRLF